jgi:hypothetical protein
MFFLTINALSATISVLKNQILFFFSTWFPRLLSGQRGGTANSFLKNHLQISYFCPFLHIDVSIATFAI